MFIVFFMNVIEMRIRMGECCLIVAWDHEAPMTKAGIFSDLRVLENMFR